MIYLWRDSGLARLYRQRHRTFISSGLDQCACQLVHPWVHTGEESKTGRWSSKITHASSFVMYRDGRHIIVLNLGLVCMPKTERWSCSSCWSWQALLSLVEIYMYPLVGACNSKQTSYSTVVIFHPFVTCQLAFWSCHAWIGSDEDFHLPVSTACLALLILACLLPAHRQIHSTQITTTKLILTL